MWNYPIFKFIFIIVNIRNERKKRRIISEDDF